MMNYEDFLSESGASRRPSPLRRFSKIGRETTTPIIDLSPGLPNTELFPFVGAKFQLRDGTTLELSEEDLKVAQNYSSSSGIKPLVAFLTEITCKIHNPPNMGANDPERALEVIINQGSTHGLTLAAQLILSRGSQCLVTERCYSTFLETLRCIGSTPLPVRLNDDGPDIAHLVDVLSQWNPEDKANWATRPKLFYLVPNGNNPSGETISAEKRRQIYGLARRYDFIILEDDPYYAIQYDEPMLPSFLSMDTDGRVIRCDSFSKILNAGFRVGWVSGPRTLITRMMYAIQVETQHANVLSQVVMHRLFQAWGVDGFLENCKAVRDFYRERRDVLVTAVENNLTGFATWSVPRAGLFMWIKLATVADVDSFVMGNVLGKGALFTPGDIFSVDQSGPQSQYIRVAFSKEPAEKLVKGIEILAKAIQDISPRNINGVTDD